MEEIIFFVGLLSPALRSEKSNPEWLDGKHEIYLCAVPSPKMFSDIGVSHHDVT